MLKQTVISFAFEKANIPIGDIEQIQNDNAAIININGTNVGIYKDTSGNIFSVKPVTVGRVSTQADASCEASSVSAQSSAVKLWFSVARTRSAFLPHASMRTIS